VNEQHCPQALYQLTQGMQHPQRFPGGLRFRGLRGAPQAEEVMSQHLEAGAPRGRGDPGCTARTLPGATTATRDTSRGPGSTTPRSCCSPLAQGRSLSAARERQGLDWHSHTWQVPQTHLKGPPKTVRASEAAKTLPHYINREMNGSQVFVITAVAPN